MLLAASSVLPKVLYPTLAPTLKPISLSGSGRGTSSGTGSGSGSGGVRFTDVRSAAQSCAAFDTALLAQSRSMLYWHATHRYCNGCGLPTSSRYGGYMRQCSSVPKDSTEAEPAGTVSTGASITTTATGATSKPVVNCSAPNHFPRSDPVTILLIHSPDRRHVLLSRQPHFQSGVYSCVAGFVEPGESLEESARRECMEEVGVELDSSILYHSSQPWPFPYSLMIGCFAQAKSSPPPPTAPPAAAPLQAQPPLPKIVIDPHELEAAYWFTNEQLRAMIHNSTLPTAALTTTAAKSVLPMTTTSDALAGPTVPVRIPPPLGIAHILCKLWLQTIDAEEAAAKSAPGTNK